MGFLSKLFFRSDLQSAYRQAISDFLTGADADTVKSIGSNYVSPSTAMSLTAVWSCLRIISWTIASLPLNLYREVEPRGKARVYDGLYDLLHNSPNSEMTSFRWRELMALHQNLWGAGVSMIERDSAGRPTALWPLPPWKIKVMRSEDTTFYRLTTDRGQTVNYMSNDLLIFPSLSANIYQWQSPISTHRQTLAAAGAVKDFGYKTFSQGTNPAGILSGVHVGDEDSDDSIRSKFTTQYEGLSNSHKLMILDEGLKFEKVGLPPEDAQYLETRQFDISEIARIYNVPLHLLQSYEKATTWGSGLEELNASFLTYTIRPYLVQWEQEINKKLVMDKNHFAEFNFEGLLRGKLLDRCQAYHTGRLDGWLSTNDIREKENLNPIEGGDSYWMPVNMQDINRPDLSKEPAQTGVLDSKKFIEELKSILIKE